MKKINLQKIFKIALIIFLVIQPIFDLKIFYNSISTLIRVAIIGIIFLYYFITSKSHKKYFLLIYPALIVIYFVFHHGNAMNFTSLVPGNFNYSVFKEMLYFVKMISPFLLLYSLIKAKLKNEEIFLIMKSIVLFISMIIIASNIFVFSYGSYSDAPIKANIFSWFTNNGEYTYQDLASKGLFEYANQIGAVLIMFLPFCLYEAFKNKNFINIFSAFANIFALLLLSTKVSVFGIAVVMAYTLCVYLFKNIFIDKQKFKISFGANQILAILMMGFYAIIVVFNPTFARMNEAKEVSARVAQIQENIVENVEIKTDKNENIQTNISNIEKEEIISTENNEEKEELTQPEKEYKDFKTQFIEENYKKNEINELFIIERYPYIYDAEFWYNIISSDNPNKMHYRFLEEEIVKRVAQINNNPYDKWFGITNTRLQNIFNIEKDFVVQYYALGIIGLILVFMPYLEILIWFIYKTLSTKLKNLSLINMFAFVTIFFLFAISYYSGNLLNSLSFTIYFTILFLLLLSKESSDD